MQDGVKEGKMRKDIILTFIFTLIQIALITIIKGFSYPLLLLFFMIAILSYISIEDWKTGLISIPLNVAVLIISGIFAFFNGVELKTVGINLLFFVIPFILLEAIFQLFINKDDERFLVGGGDIILFATMSLILDTFDMCVMLFSACLMSIIASKIIKKSMVHFAPFIQVGFLVAFLLGKYIKDFIF